MAQPASDTADVTYVRIEGRDVRLTNLAKVYWPSIGLTKADLVDYYARVAPALLPHLADRPLTLHRFPDGIDGVHWYETRAPAHPPWVRTQEMHVFPKKDVHAPVVDDLPALVWAANAGAVELHPYLGTTRDLARPTVVVFDLDPGPPAALPDTARVALALRAVLDGLGLASFPKTSGGKGLHVFVPLNSETAYDLTKAFARAVARHLVEEDPALVLDVMTRAKRPGKVFVDWSQNDAGKSTVAPYSLRGLWYPTVSMPVTWDEIEAAAGSEDGRGLVFLLHDVPRRLDARGDLFAPVLTTVQALPGP